MHELVSSWFNNDKVDGANFRQALLTNDLDLMNTHLSHITKNIFSFFDTGGDEPERFYHAFVLGLIVDLKGRYEITSNRESGYGRYDVMMIPSNGCDHGIVIEFKTRDTKNEQSLQKTCANALQQIYKQQYVTQLLNRNVDASNIYVYGFAFQGKDVLILGGAWQSICEQN